MKRLVVGDFGGDWMVAETRGGIPTAFASVEKGTSDIVGDSRLFDSGEPPIWFSHLDYRAACSAMSKCGKTAVVDVDGDSTTLVEANVDLEADPEFARYACL